MTSFVLISHPRLEQVLHHLLVVYRAVLLLGLAHVIHGLHLLKHPILSSKWKLHSCIVLFKIVGSQCHFNCHNLLRILANNSIRPHALDTIASKAFLADTFEKVKATEGSVRLTLGMRITGRNMSTVTQHTVTVVLVLTWENKYKI